MNWDERIERFRRVRRSGKLMNRLTCEINENPRMCLLASISPEVCRDGVLSDFPGELMSGVVRNVVTRAYDQSFTKSQKRRVEDFFHRFIIAHRDLGPDARKVSLDILHLLISAKDSVLPPGDWYITALDIEKYVARAVRWQRLYGDWYITALDIEKYWPRPNPYARFFYDFVRSLEKEVEIRG